MEHACDLHSTKNSICYLQQNNDTMYGLHFKHGTWQKNNAFLYYSWTSYHYLKLSSACSYMLSAVVPLTYYYKQAPRISLK